MNQEATVDVERAARRRAVSIMKAIGRLMPKWKSLDVAQQLAQLVEQRDELVRQRDEFMQQRDDLIQQRHDLIQQREILTNQRTDLLARLDATAKHLDDLAMQRDAIGAERHAAALQLDQFTLELMRLSSVALERDRLRLLLEKSDTSERFSQTFSDPRNPDLVRARFLDLMELVLIGKIYDDPPIKLFHNDVFDAKQRNRGLDWPKTAYSMIGAARMRNLRVAIETAIIENVAGDIVETGVWRGGACILARAVLKAYDIMDRRVLVCDSFEGLPPPDQTQFPADAGSTFHTFPELAITEEQVRENFKKFDLLDDRVTFVKGWFKDSMPTLPTQRIAVLRLDGDMYESTIDPLKHLYEKVSPGGWIIVDDYEVVPACKQAVTDFLQQRNENPVLSPIDGVGVYFRKPSL